MSLYSKYVQERLSWNVIEKDYGFIVWSEGKDHYVIEELFVSFEDRGNGYSKDLVAEVEAEAIMNKVPYILAYVWPHTKGSTEAIATAIKLGGKLMGAEGGKIILQKKVY